MDHSLERNRRGRKHEPARHFDVEQPNARLRVGYERKRRAGDDLLQHFAQSILRIVDALASLDQYRPAIGRNARAVLGIADALRKSDPQQKMAWARNMNGEAYASRASSGPGADLES